VRLAATDTVSAEFKARVLRYRNQGELAAAVDMQGANLSAYINGQKFGPHVREKIARIAARLGMTEAEAIVEVDRGEPTFATIVEPVYAAVAGGRDPKDVYIDRGCTFLDYLLPRPRDVDKPTMKAIAGGLYDVGLSERSGLIQKVRANGDVCLRPGAQEVKAACW